MISPGFAKTNILKSEHGISITQILKSTCWCHAILPRTLPSVNNWFLFEPNEYQKQKSNRVCRPAVQRNIKK